MPPVRRQNIGRRLRRWTQRQNNRQNEAQSQQNTRPPSNESIRNQNIGRRSRRSIQQQQQHDPTVEYADNVMVSIGAMSSVCQYCKAFKYVNESIGLCCASGKVRLPLLLPPPEPLASLISGQHPRSTHFLQNIQHYNSCFQMTSFGANVIRPQGFNPTFKVTSNKKTGRNV